MQAAIRIGKVHAHCQLWAASAAAPAFGDRVASAVRRDLSDSLRRSLAGWFEQYDHSVWVVRRIECSVLTGSDATTDALASALAASLTKALSSTLSGDGDGANSIRFASRAAYLAQFVADVAAGHAWARWYYAPFAGLKALPASAAIRTALVANPNRSREALALLDDRTLGSVAAALTTDDEARLLEVLSAGGADGELSGAVLATARSACRRARTLLLERGHILFAFIRADITVPSAALLRALPAMLDAIEREPPTVTLPAAHITTRLAGLCLLLRDLDELPWSDWTADWPAPAAGDAIGALKWLTLALCAGPARATRVFDDTGARVLFGVPSGGSTRELRRWLRQAGAARRRALLADSSAPPLTREERAWFDLPGHAGITGAWRDALAPIAATVLRSFARRLPGFAASTPEHLWRNLLDFEATIELEEQRVVVRCGRPPLHLLLTLTGMTRGLVAGRDAEGRAILLFPEA